MRFETDSTPSLASASSPFSSHSSVPTPLRITPAPDGRCASTSSYPEATLSPCGPSSLTLHCDSLTMPTKRKATTPPFLQYLPDAHDNFAELLSDQAKLEFLERTYGWLEDPPNDHNGLQNRSSKKACREGKGTQPTIKPEQRDSPNCDDDGDIEVIISPEFSIKQERVEVITDDPRLQRFCLAYFPGKGHGLRATAHIDPGQLIIAERPFFIVTHPIPADAAVITQVNRLSDHHKILFLSLTAASVDQRRNPVESAKVGEPGGESGEDPRSGHTLLHRPSQPSSLADIYASIAETNVIPLGDTRLRLPNGVHFIDGSDNLQYLPQSGLFEHISRVNHSCVPNSRWSWDYQEAHLELIATRAIEPGVEITACYSDISLKPWAERRKFTMENFGFICTCPACSLSGIEQAASDHRLVELAEIQSLVFPTAKYNPTLKSSSSPEAWSDHDLAIRKHHGALQILKQEDRSWEVPEWWASLFHLHVEWGMREEANKVANEAVKAYEAVGRHEEAERMMRAGGKPEGMSRWRCLERKRWKMQSKLGGPNRAATQTATGRSVSSIRLRRSTTSSSIVPPTERIIATCSPATHDSSSSASTIEYWRPNHRSPYSRPGSRTGTRAATQATRSKTVLEQVAEEADDDSHSVSSIHDPNSRKNFDIIGSTPTQLTSEARSLNERSVSSTASIPASAESASIPPSVPSFAPAPATATAHRSSPASMPTSPPTRPPASHTTASSSSAASTLLPPPAHQPLILLGNSPLVIGNTGI